jgi:hypothetical protein
VSRAAEAMGRLRASVDPSSKTSVTCTDPPAADVPDQHVGLCVPAPPRRRPRAQRGRGHGLPAARCESDQTVVPGRPHTRPRHIAR